MAIESIDMEEVSLTETEIKKSLTESAEKEAESNLRASYPDEYAQLLRNESPTGHRKQSVYELRVRHPEVFQLFLENALEAEFCSIRLITRVKVKLTWEE